MTDNNDGACSSDIIAQHEQELECRRRRFGESHPAVAETLNILGLFYHHVTRDQLKSLHYHEEALDILRAQPGSFYSADKAVTLTDLGNVYRAMNNGEKALTSYEEALVLFHEIQVPEQHPAFLSAYRGVEMLRRGTSEDANGFDVA
mmetsp:Transcript_9022/g.12477  ORF Transcript_9022/g.12477 Transcript_9022/m.12477 type:complete len:147 (-) Transcript_9022:364-804(-)|eukprot:CAMPEP_0185726484 /NCGR_PEP_ID=MMETSP1171-20130828/2457_1 /TAXON_ID=374046 /ORGANISM="Helicotheca tamensis, Strain CCMP826" /LENGTH=146 /DNA_ID=CAMNT_0028394851 /DNA_START=164 /DNA_END=604 /DNA_ORIENTATION=-